MSNIKNLKRLENLILNEIMRIRENNLINKFKIVYKGNVLKCISINEYELKKSNNWIIEKGIKNEEVKNILKGLAL